MRVQCSGVKFVLLLSLMIGSKQIQRFFFYYGNMDTHGGILNMLDVLWMSNIKAAILI